MENKIRIISPRDLEDAIRDFNRTKTRLRISTTSACNLTCTFCHAEGLDEYNGLVLMNIDEFNEIVQAYSEIGGKEINLTGGEPLLHPQIKTMIQRINRLPQQYLTLSTNGLKLDKINLNPEQHQIGETKVSVHTFNEELAKTMLGKTYDVKKLKTNVREHVNKGYRTIINLTLTSKNMGELEEIIEWAIETGINMKISDLGKTNNNGVFFDNSYENPHFVKEIVEKYSVDEEVLGGSRSGNTLLRYILSNGNHILLKDMNQGKHETEMCDDCHKKQHCSEGVFALRVNPNGSYQPCLLRTEFNTNTNTLQSPKERLSIGIYKMMRGVSEDIMLLK